MTEADTPVVGAPDSQKSETPQDSQPQEAQAQQEGETRTPEQVDQSISYQQSRADKAENTVKELEERIGEYKNLDVLKTQLENDGFAKDINGYYKVPEQTTEPNYDPEDMMSGKQVQESIDKRLKPLEGTLGLIAETSKAEKMGLTPSQQELISASNTPTSAAERLDYERLKADEAKATAHQDGIKEVTSQIQNAQSNSPSIANANSIPEPVEEPKTENETKNEGIMAAMRQKHTSGIDISYKD